MITQGFIIFLITGMVGMLARWGRSVYTRNKENRRLQEEKQADIAIHSKVDQDDANSIDPPSAYDNSDRV